PRRRAATRAGRWLPPASGEPCAARPDPAHDVPADERVECSWCDLFFTVAGLPRRPRRPMLATLSLQTATFSLFGNIGLRIGGGGWFRMSYRANPTGVRDTSG